MHAHMHSLFDIGALEVADWVQRRCEATFGLID